MRDEQLEKRIADAVQHAAPDVLDRILSSYDEQKGNVISMSEIVNTNNKRNKRRWTSLVAATPHSARDPRFQPPTSPAWT